MIEHGLVYYNGQNNGRCEWPKFQINQKAVFISAFLSHAIT